MRWIKNIQGFLQPLDEAACNLLSETKVGQAVEMKQSGKPTKPRRSTMQNAYYFGAVIPYFVNATDGSYNKDDFHYWLKCEIFGEKEMGGRRVPKKRTRDLTTDQMEKYLAKCREIAWIRFEVIVPKPNECGYSY